MNIPSVGERYDFILEANRPIANYWLQVEAHRCGNGYAVIHYEGAPDTDPLMDRHAYRTGTVRI